MELGSVPCIFLGYSPHHLQYKCLNPTTNRIFMTRHVQFFEQNFSYQLLLHQTSPTVQSLPQSHPIFPPSLNLNSSPTHISLLNWSTTPSAVRTHGPLYILQASSNQISSAPYEIATEYVVSYPVK